MAGPFSKQDHVSILDTFKAKLNSEWKYRACHWHNAKSQGGCLRADSENGEWVTHCCTKDFYHTAEIIKWMLMKDGKTEQTNLAALLSAAQDSVHDLRNEPGRLRADELGKGDRRCYIVFAILLNLDCGSRIHAFQRCGITDGNLSNERLSNLDTLKDELQGSVSDVNKLLSNFDDMRFKFQHVVMDLNTPTVYSDRQRGRWISPFCRRQLINNKGGTAQVWQVSVQDQFLSLGLKERLKRSEYIDPVYGKCYSMALKTFTSENKHVFNREKLNYSAVEGLAGMVQYLGEYEVDEEIDGQRVVRTWNLLLEFGDLDLEELFFSPKDPPSAFETIIEFWEALSKVAEAVERIHNLEAHRGHGDSVRYHGWHADIKPDNILRVRGEFKLADLGFAKFRMKDETGAEPKTILMGLTETYGAPETDRRRRCRLGGTMTDYTQSIDIWSLGCVFSVAATWVVLGRQGVSVYEKLRQISIKQLRSSQSERQPTADDAFHDGYDVLKAVTDWHNHLRSSIRKSDTITPKILDLIEDEMLRREPRQRLPSSKLILKFAEDIAAARGTHSFQADRGKLTRLSDDIKDAIRQVEEEAEHLANLDGEGDTMKALSPLEQGVSDRTSGALLAHSSHQSTRRNKSELLRQAKKSMRLPRRDNIGTSSHLTSRMGKQSFVAAGPTHGVLASELRPSPVPQVPFAHRLRERSDDTPGASLPPRIVIGEPQVESPELMPVNRLESQSRDAQPLGDATSPEREATTQGVYPGSLKTQDSVKTHYDPNARSPSTEETDALFITATSSRSSSRDERTPRITIANGFNFSSPSKQFHIDPNWPICRQFESIRKKGFLKQLLGGNDKHLSSFLVNRDIKFVIDNGGSMSPYWPAMRIALETLASMIGRLDKNGLDIEFTLGKDHNISNAKVSRLLEKFEKAKDEALRPQDPLMTRTDMAMILGQIFIEYLKDTSKPMTLIVFTDGVWEGTYSDKGVETSIVEFLRNDDIRKKFSGIRWFSIEFVSFGEAGVEKLEGLDNDLESKYGIQDVIDHERVSGNVYKMILGSLNTYYDAKPSDTLPMSGSSSLSPGSLHSSTEPPTPVPLSRQNSTSKGRILSRIIGKN